MSPTRGRPPAPPLAAELVEKILVCFLPGDPASLLRAALVCKPSCRIVSAEGFCSRFRIVFGEAFCSRFRIASSEASTDAGAAPQLLIQARLRAKTSYRNCCYSGRFELSISSGNGPRPSPRERTAGGVACRFTLKNHN